VDDDKPVIGADEDQKAVGICLRIGTQTSRGAYSATDELEACVFDAVEIATVAVVLEPIEEATK
jgi:hypothetical protein